VPAASTSTAHSDNSRLGELEPTIRDEVVDDVSKR